MNRWAELAALGPRRTGRTTAICEAAKKIGATVLAANYQHKKYLEQFGVNAIPVDNEEAIECVAGPILFDHYTLERVFAEYEKEISGLVQENRKLCNEIGRLYLREA